MMPTAFIITAGGGGASGGSASVVSALPTWTLNLNSTGSGIIYPTGGVGAPSGDFYVSKTTKSGAIIGAYLLGSAGSVLVLTGPDSNSYLWTVTTAVDQDPYVVLSVTAAGTNNGLGWVDLADYQLTFWPPPAT